MKRIVFIVFFYFIRLLANGQEFMTKLYFEDSNMHYDTLIVGYDQNATDSIDLSFGENDINGTPFDSIFEVRATDEYKLAYRAIPYLVKKQIVKKECEESKFPFVSAILVKCKYYPIKISWDKALFDDNCTNYSLITDWNPGGWFDVGGIQPPYYLKVQDAASFPYISDNRFYYEHNNTLLDTVQLLYFAFASKQNFDQILYSGTKLDNTFSIYPTLCNDRLFIKLNSNDQIEDISFVDLYGRILTPKVKNEAIDVSSFHSGIYVVHVRIRGVNIVFNNKIIKL